jgi:hypothetical protein
MSQRNGWPKIRQDLDRHRSLVPLTGTGSFGARLSHLNIATAIGASDVMSIPVCLSNACGALQFFPVTGMVEVGSPDRYDDATTTEILIRFIQAAGACGPWQHSQWSNPNPERLRIHQVDSEKKAARLAHPPSRFLEKSRLSPRAASRIDRVTQREVGAGPSQ